MTRAIIGFWKEAETLSCNFPSGNFADGNPICDWGYRQELIIQATQVNTSMVNPVLYISLTSLGTDFWSNVRSDGGDIRITKSDGISEMAFDHQSDMIDTVNDKGFLYFRFNGTVSSSTNTSIYLYWGNVTATGYGASATYGMNNCWQDYEGVYGMWENPATGIQDRTGVLGDLTNVGATQTTDAQYINAVDFDGNNDYLQGGDRHDVFANDLWLRVHFNSNADNGVMQAIMHKANGSTLNGRWATYIRWHNNNDVFATISQAGIDASTNGDVISTSTWYTYDFVADRGSTSKLYGNGSLENTSTANNDTNSYNTSLQFTIGAYRDSGNNVDRYFNGQMRGAFGINFSAPNGDEISTYRNNENDNANFFNFSQSVETS